MYNQILSSLNEFIESDLSFDSDQKKTLLRKHKLTLTDSLQKGHWTTNLCLIASNLAKKNPRDIASALIPRLESLPGVATIELAGPGFINIFLQREIFLNQLDDAHINPQSFLDQSNSSWMAPSSAPAWRKSSSIRIVQTRGMAVCRLGRTRRRRHLPEGSAARAGGLK